MAGIKRTDKDTVENESFLANEIFSDMFEARNKAKEAYLVTGNSRFKDLYEDIEWLTDEFKLDS